jgi:hypothetical protein
MYSMFFWSSSDSWQLKIYYIPWPAKKLLPKFLTKFVCQKQPKSVQPAQPTGQSCQKTNFKKTYYNNLMSTDLYTIVRSLRHVFYIKSRQTRHVFKMFVIVIFNLSNTTRIGIDFTKTLTTDIKCFTTIFRSVSTWGVYTRCIQEVTTRSIYTKYLHKVDPFFSCSFLFLNV